MPASGAALAPVGLGLSLLALWLAGSPAQAAAPRGTLGLDLGVIFTDNLYLSPLRKEADTVIQVRPTFSLGRRGKRVEADVNFAPVGYLYAGHQDLNDVQFVLDAGVSWEAIERWFFLDLAATANQVAVDPGNRFGVVGGRTGFDSVANNGAFTQAATVSVTPRIEFPVAAGRFARVSFQPGFGTVFQASTARSQNNQRTGVADTRLTVTSGPVFVKTPWSLQWQSRVFDTEAEQRVGRFSFTQGYVVNRRYLLEAVLGYDEGSFEADNGQDGGLRWELRLRWTPRRDSAFQIGFGEAYYGTFWNLRALHRHKRWALQGSYQVSVESAASSLLDQRVVPVEDLFGNPIQNPLAGQVLAANIATPALTDEEFLSQQFQLGLAWQHRRSGAQFQWQAIQRDYANGDTFDSLLSLNATRALSRRFRAALGLQYWSHIEDAGMGRDFTQQAVNLTLAYRLGPKATLNTRVARQNRDAEFALDTFTENRLTFDLSLQL